MSEVKLSEELYKEIKDQNSEKKSKKNNASLQTIFGFGNRRAARSPKVYVHQITELNAQFLQCSSKYAKASLFRRQLLARSDGLGPKLPTSLEEKYKPYVARYTSQYATEMIIHHKFLSYKHRVMKLDEADFEYIPLYTHSMMLCMRYVEMIYKSLPPDKARMELQTLPSHLRSVESISEHAMRSVRSIVTSSPLLKRRLRTATSCRRSSVSGRPCRDGVVPHAIVTISDPISKLGNMLHHQHRFWPNNTVVIGVDAATRKLSNFFVMIPYASTMHIPTLGVHRAVLHRALYGHKRPTHGQYAGKPKLRDRENYGMRSNGFRLETVLRDAIALWNKDTSRDTVTPRFQFSYTTADGYKEKVWEFFEAKWRSVFCFEPGGELSNRRSFYDTILAGCIPVIFRNDTYESLLSFQFREYGRSSRRRKVTLQDIALLIPVEDVIGGRVNLLETVSKITQQQIDHYRNSIVNIIPWLQYSLGSFEVPTDGWTSSPAGHFARGDAFTDVISYLSTFI
ncbi:hypothetical protein BJ742DRAFT_886192 [Cladochytrium replicatum]|nr:hypothetical protein BJ742DRAFT_886192 [Cladochytrium replicatum]